MSLSRRQFEWSSNGATFEGAEYDDDTVFPDSFEPEKEGMLFRSQI
jgi:hypothetical protein